jgi:hypothetical protein
LIRILLLQKKFTRGLDGASWVLEKWY